MNWTQNLLRSLPPDAFAWILVGLCVIAAWLLWRAARRVVRWGYFILYAAIGFALQTVTQPLYSHAQVPLQYTIIGSIVFAGFCMAVRSRVMRIVGCVATIAIMYAISNTLTGGLNSSAFLPSNDSRSPQAATEDDFQHLKSGAFASTMKREAPKIAKLPKGWLSEPPYSKWGFSYYVRDRYATHRVNLWHSWLTGLVESRQVALDIWSPGGSVKQVQAGLELRERPEKPVPLDD